MSEKKEWPESIKYLMSKNYNSALTNPGDTDGDEVSLPPGKLTMISSIGGPGKSTFFDKAAAEALAARGRILAQSTEANCTYGVGSEYVEVKRHPKLKLPSLGKTMYHLTFDDIEFISDEMEEKIKNAIHPYMFSNIDKDYYVSTLENIVIIVIDESLFESKNRDMNVTVIPKITKLFGKTCSVEINGL